MAHSSSFIKKTCVAMLLLVSSFMVASSSNPEVMAKEATSLSSSTFGQMIDYIREFNHGRMLESKSKKPQCQNLKLTGDMAKVVAATGDGVQVEMKKQRVERVKCNLDCMLRTKSTDWISYANSFPHIVVLPSVCFLLCILVFPCWICCRCCSKCCGKSMGYGCLCKCCCFMPQKSGPYTKTQSGGIVVVYFIFALATFICAIVGLASGTGFGNSLVEATCQFDSTRVSANTILSRILSPAERINKLIPFILKNVNVESTKAMAKRDGRYTQDAQKELITRMNEFHAYAKEVYNMKCGKQDINVRGNYTCKICVLKESTTPEETIDKLNALTKEPAEKVKKDREQVIKFIIKAGDMITSVVKQFTDSMETVVDYIDDGGEWDKLGETAIAGAIDAKNYAPAAAAGPFAVVIAGIILTFIGIFFLRACPGKRENTCNLGKTVGGYLVGFSWCSTCFAITITFLICQILWPFTFVVTDVCIVLDNVPKNVSTYVPMDPYSSSLLQSCFDNRTVLPPGSQGTGNSTGGLDFASNVGFGSVKPLNEVDGDLHKLFDWPFLDNETAMVKEMGANLNESPPSGANACERNRTLALFKMKRMHANITAEKKLFKKYMNISIRSMYEIKEHTKPMFTVGDIMMAGFKCGEVAVEYKAMTGILCGNMLGSITNLISAWLATAIFGMFLAYLGLKINQRWGGHGFHPEREDDDEGFEMTINDNFTVKGKLV